MDAADIRWLRELEEENRRLRQISAELLLENRALKDVIEKSCYAGGQARTRSEEALRSLLDRRLSGALVHEICEEMEAIYS